MLMMIADTIMVGKVGVTELAALTFASAIFSIPFVFGIGLVSSISVLSSAAVGKKDHAETRGVCRNGFYLAIGTAAALCLFSLALIPFLSHFRQPEDVTAITPPYLTLILISLIPALGSIGLKNHSDSLGHPWPGFCIFLSGVLLNIILNQLFIFTLDLGLTGAGWATLISRFAILFGMLLWFTRTKTIAHLTPKRWFAKLDPMFLRQLLALGIPASLHLLAEVAAFSAAGFLVGFYGEVALAAHQVALTTASTLFMLPLGIALALTIRIGNAAGAGEKERYPAIIASGWLLTLGCVCLTALSCGLGRHIIADFYVDDAEVIALSVRLLIIVAIFQFVDSFQVVSAGLLRGLKDVRIPAWTAFTAYWIFGIPLGWLLATTEQMEAAGIWWGLAAGLAIAAIFLCWRTIKLSTR